MLFLDSCKPVFNISYCKSTSMPLWKMFKKLLQAPNYPLEESKMIFTISISYNVYIVEKESHGCCDTNDINRYETITCSWHVVRLEHKFTVNTVNISHFTALVGRYGLNIKCADQQVIFTARQRSYLKVIFSLASVCHSVHRWWGSQCVHYHDTLDITREGNPQPNPTPSSGHRTSLYRDTSCPTPARDIWWAGLEICSNCSLEDSPTFPLVLTSGDYWSTYTWQADSMASYCNTFLLVIYH